jgi:hypothetical protein
MIKAPYKYPYRHDLNELNALQDSAVGDFLANLKMKTANMEYMSAV